MKLRSKRQALCALATIGALVYCNMKSPATAQAEGIKATEVQVRPVAAGVQVILPEVETIVATEEETPEPEEPVIEEPDPLAEAECLGEFRVTYYCAEARPHICGTGDGITASGRPLTPYFSAAVDPTVIPLGSKLAIDFGDGELHYYSADDVGSAVKDAHIDLAVEGHQEALAQTRTQATVWILH